MEIFWAYRISGDVCFLDADESGHCVRVLRHRAGDEIDVIDGEGTLLHCRLTDDNPRGAQAQILSAVPEWNAHPYNLSLACCPTKNNERFEWFVEKASEVGVDTIFPLIGEHSERKVYKTERAKRIALSATKQSLKARIPSIPEPRSVKVFLKESRDGLKLIACCFEGENPRITINEALAQYQGSEITILIGPEGDFSEEEVALAVKEGYLPISLGASRLRTETAAVAAVMAVYLRAM